jgi:hypothetical protein
MFKQKASPLQRELAGATAARFSKPKAGERRSGSTKSARWQFPADPEVNIPIERKSYTSL